MYIKNNKPFGFEEDFEIETMIIGDFANAGNGERVQASNIIFTQFSYLCGLKTDLYFGSSQ